MATQFQGVFGDNAFKNLVILLILGAGLSTSTTNKLVPAVLFLFSLPFILFSMGGGYLADRFSKRTVTIGTKVFEIGVALVALIGLATGNFPLELLAVFLFSTEGALFGPTKYGLLPELLPERLLSWGNGVLELGTFLAILTGTMAAGYLSDIFRGRQGWSGVVFLALAFVGTTTSLGITRLPAADPQRRLRLNFLSDLRAAIVEMRRDHLLWQAVVGNTTFWFLGGLLQPVIILYGKEVMHLSDAHNTWLQAALAVGIGAGSLAVGYLSGGRIEYGLVPLGTMGMTVAAVWLGFSAPVFYHILLELAVLGFFAGFFSVPVLALAQHRPDPNRRGLVLAGTNLLSFVGIFAAGGAYYLLIGALKLTSAQVFLAGAAITLLCTLYALFVVEDCALRLFLWIVTHTVCWLRITGRDAIPEKGSVIFLCQSNTAWAALWLISATNRRIQFVETPPEWWGPLAKRMKSRGGATDPAETDGKENDVAAALCSLSRGDAACLPDSTAPPNISPEDSAAALAQDSGAAIVRVTISAKGRGQPNFPAPNFEERSRFPFLRVITIQFAPASP